MLHPLCSVIIDAWQGSEISLSALWVQVPQFQRVQLGVVRVVDSPDPSETIIEIVTLVRIVKEVGSLGDMECRVDQCH